MADFTNKDFKDTYEAMLDFVEHLTTRWSPRTSSEADPGVVLLKAFALQHDAQRYAFDMARAQGYLNSVSNRQDAFDLLQMLGYSMKGARSSTGLVAISSKDNFQTENVLPRFTVITDNSETVSYFTTSLTEVSLPVSNGHKVLVEVMEGSVFKILKEGFDTFSIKDLDEGGRFFLQKRGLAENGVFVLSVVNGEEISDWEYLDMSTLRMSGKYFSLRTSDSGENYIQFPEDFSTLIGSGEFVVYATYTKGLGGAVPSKTLCKAKGVSSNFIVTQDTATSGGADAQSIREAINEYNKTKEVFGTLISKHDYEAAISALRIDGNKLFSNCWADTALSRQLLIRARTATAAYVYYLNDEITPVNQVDVFGLKNSANYIESYTVEDSVLKRESLNGALAQNKSLGTTINMVNTPKILAVTSPIGEIKTSQDAQGLLTKILELIKDSYNASNQYFGKEIDYAQLLALLKGAAEGISLVSLSPLRYQVYKGYDEDMGQGEPLGLVHKTLVAAKAILAGDTPLFKYKNKGGMGDIGANTTDGVLTAVIGTNGFDVFNGGNPSVPMVSDIDNGFLQQKADANVGIITLVQNQVLQVMCANMKPEVAYGAGTKYKGVKTVVGTIVLTEDATLLAGTYIKGISTATVDGLNEVELLSSAGSSVIFPDGEVSLEGVSGYIGTVNEVGAITWEDHSDDIGIISSADSEIALITGDYTVMEAYLVKANTRLFAGSKIAANTVINSLQYGVLPIGRDYTLLEGETFSLTISGVTTTFESPTVLNVSGITISFNDTEKTLTTTQTINKMKLATVPIDTTRRYFLKLKEVPDEGKDLRGGYVLDDGEFFIYTNASKTEYISLGPGTILTEPSGVKFKNIYPISIDNLNATYEPVPATITATLTTLNTFQEGTKFKYSGNDIPINWDNIAANEELEIYDALGENVLSTYSSPYKIRLPLVIISELDGTVYIPYPQAFTLTSGVNTLTVDATDSSREGVYLSVSKPIYAALTLGGAPLAPLAGDIVLAKYTYTDFGGAAAEGGACDVLAIKNSIKITVSETLGDEKYVSVPFPLIPDTKMILCHLSIVGAGVVEGDNITFKVLESVSGTVATGYPNSVKDMYTDTVMSYSCIGTTNTFLQISPKNHHESSGGENLIVYFNTTSNSSFLGTEIILDTFSYVDDFSDELCYSKSQFGEALASTTADYYAPSIANLTGGALFGALDATYAVPLLSKIRTLDAHNVFDWLYESPKYLKHPTASMSYLNPKHPFNNKTLPYISLYNTKSSLHIGV